MHTRANLYIEYVLYIYKGKFSTKSKQMKSS